MFSCPRYRLAKQWARARAWHGQRGRVITGETPVPRDDATARSRIGYDAVRTAKPYGYERAV